MIDVDIDELKKRWIETINISDKHTIWCTGTSVQVSSKWKFEFTGPESRSNSWIYFYIVLNKN